MEIKSKNRFYELYNKGLFGNKALAWNNLAELKKSKYDGPISIRGIHIPREQARYNVQISKLDKILEEYKKRGTPIEKLKFNQSMPDENLLIQGEVMRSSRHFELTYTTIKKPMNEALKEKSIYEYGLRALILLKSNLWPSSFSDLEALFDNFEDSIIEFSAYSCKVGDIPNRNTIIWEVRNY